MSSRITKHLASLRSDGRKALIPFFTAGDPHPSVTVPTMHAMVEAGADIIELGVPFSDPMADGPVIQHASERALLHHVGMRDVLAMVNEFRQGDNQTPVVLMGYLNPIEVMGYEAFARAAAEAGVDGVLTVDMPPEEGHEFVSALHGQGLDPIFLLAPTTSEARIGRICELASGFVYYVSVKGITGAANLDTDEVARRVELIRSKTSLPVGVGFGIKDGASAARVATVADAVVVGSALVSRIEALQHESDKIPAKAAEFIRELRTAMDG
ncbi:MAG: tryptophan synthase subunit alpha [Gammaproteobacteria bacterium]|nr:tryptophan synthase subunit alpha [Gammaproteobacteria bacterium]